MGEIDLVVRKGDCLSFVEVKSRHNKRYGRPAEAVTLIKQQHIRRVAQYCLLREQYALQIDKNTDFRFDVCEVLDTPEGTQICYIENAF
jgi:putative endonuclease